MLDEADRLLDLGFEQKLKAIIQVFDARSNGSNGNNNGIDNGVDGSSPSTPPATGQQQQHRRQTVLLSATLHPGLSTLAGLSLQDPVAVGFKAQLVDGQLQLLAEDGSTLQQQSQQQQGGSKAGGGEQLAFELPHQLQQKFVEVEAKMRLVYLIGE